MADLAHPRSGIGMSFPFTPLFSFFVFSSIQAGMEDLVYSFLSFLSFCTGSRLIGRPSRESNWHIGTGTYMSFFVFGLQTDTNQMRGWSLGGLTG
ncbi:hypothetical protein F4809DRAFT_633736 [Biscogniauxia mediterranea]|nr:hypothetical protein F4809DRAFT_633736 [Biscogniauxia mediterranea]